MADVPRNRARHYGWQLRGRKQALLASGLAKAEWFASGRKRGPRGGIIRRKRNLVDGREIITDLPARGCVSVTVTFCGTEAELEPAGKRRAAAAGATGDYRRINAVAVQRASVPPIDQGLAERLNNVVADAVRDHARSRTLRGKNYEKGKRLCDRVVNGILGRAHSWCVDFEGNKFQLTTAGLADPSWFRGDPPCKHVLVGGRTIELYSTGRRDEYEVSIWYTDAEREAS